MFSYFWLQTIVIPSRLDTLTQINSVADQDASPLVALMFVVWFSIYVGAFIAGPRTLVAPGNSASTCHLRCCSRRSDGRVIRLFAASGNEPKREKAPSFGGWGLESRMRQEFEVTADDCASLK